MLLLLPPLAWAINGGVDDVDDTAVMGIIDGVTSAECTGTLIAPDVVLTARHCVSEIVGLGCDATWGATFGTERFYVTTKAAHTFNPADYHTVSAVVVDPSRTGLCGGDVAILVLKAAVEADEAEPLDPRVDEAMTVAEPYAAVGYGATDDSGGGSGTRRRRDGLVPTCVGDCSGSGAAAGEWIGEAGVCAGDSGGPALDGSGRVVGVASRGAVSCAFPVYASLAADGWADFLRAAVVEAAASGGYDAPEWAGGGTGDDTGDTGGDTAEEGDSGEEDDSGAGRDTAKGGGDSETNDESAAGCDGCTSGSGGPVAAAAAMVILFLRRR